MAKYIINIEVENAADEDYRILTSELSKMYFKTEFSTFSPVPYLAVA